MKPFRLAILMSFLAATFVSAAEEAKPAAFNAEEAIKTLRGETDLLWLMVASILVFFMQAGFAYVETGFSRKKNVVNILMKNIADFLVGSLGFWLLGFSLMFGPQLIQGIGFGAPWMFEKLLEGSDGKPIAFNYGFLFFRWSLPAQPRRLSLAQWPSARNLFHIFSFR